VIHADVKSDNILVDRAHDGGDQIKLIDFGLGHIDSGEPTTDDHGDPIVAGTPEFMAPELIAAGSDRGVRPLRRRHRAVRAADRSHAVRRGGASQI
jgi:serine/threonine protein kinase